MLGSQLGNFLILILFKQLLSDKIFAGYTVCTTFLSLFLHEPKKKLGSILNCIYNCALWFYYSQIFKNIFAFPTFRLSAYLTKVIPETRHAR
jgi:hypothetical protein